MIGNILVPFCAGIDALIEPDTVSFANKSFDHGKDLSRIPMGVAYEYIFFSPVVWLWNVHYQFSLSSLTYLMPFTSPC